MADETFTARPVLGVTPNGLFAEPYRAGPVLQSQ
jgi:hypothetical protein